jgi:hypothetical protein
VLFCAGVRIIAPELVANPDCGDAGHKTLCIAARLRLQRALTVTSSRKRVETSLKPYARNRHPRLLQYYLPITGTPMSSGCRTIITT